MTANQQQTKMQPPYIGSKISLISKLDIRYEGTLYTVDPIESTIALAKVHSYGTEDRRTPVFVPPRDEVYDFIIFKASDIKDLIVCEQPKASNPHNTFSSGLPYDPAIVSISKNPPPEPKLPPKLNMMNACGGVNLRGTNEGGGVGEQLGNRPSFEQLLGPMRFNYRFPNFQAQQPRTKHPSGLKTNNEGLPQVFDNDYDFEKANEQFREKIIEDLKDSVEQLEVKEVVADEPTADDNKALVVKDEAMAETKTDEYYNKSQSFFDCISCDALEKESGKNVRPDWKRERQTNQETFGHTAVRNLFYQHRGARGYGSSMALHRNNYRYAPSVQPLMPAYSYRYHAHQNNFQRNGRQQMIGGGVGGSGGYRQQQQY